VITISTNKGLVKISTWEDVLHRAHFTSNLNPEQHQLDTILGKYVFQDKVRCGLSNCHTLHGRGYLVTTKTGRETNIGKDCGKNYFGLEFEEAAKRFESDFAAHENRELLWSFSFRTDDLETRIEAMRQGVGGADWVHKNAQALLDPAKLPVQITRQVGSLAKQKTNTFTVQREATEKEIEVLEQTSSRRLDRPVYVDGYSATIRGLEALYPEYNLRDLIIVEIIDKLKGFKQLSIDELTNQQLTVWKKWAVAVDLHLDRANESVAFGRELLTKHNLSPLLTVPGVQPNEYEKFELYLAQLP